MKTISVTARFDGKHIVLDEPLELAPDTQLIVTVLSPQSTERDSWHDLALRGLAMAYHDEEPSYPFTLVKQPNPEYEGG